MRRGAPVAVEYCERRRRLVGQAGLFDLRPTHNPRRWFLPVSNGVCAGRGDSLFLFGGVALL